ncbi:hypothetical protein [Actinomycetospora termitidis]|uniref:Uncharacterized protein n=1 Tax=Actinomycetospora termitidis TaxID=3053470 RepID=A0ABT7MD16_9PSEU|nr:hypothetical protein [Actinomycetospora sp. Odt1-22]MDL5158366.1 hypothetical protein [Actinomycetospora sp. Odt1-22]
MADALGRLRALVDQALSRRRVVAAPEPVPAPRPAPEDEPTPTYRAPVAVPRLLVDHGSIGRRRRPSTASG